MDNQPRLLKHSVPTSAMPVYVGISNMVFKPSQQRSSPSAISETACSHVDEISQRA